eukprot:CAMPEP_0119346196 /NCGR_PEP_ID=MMETSP1333-20130426/107881_1 /TAXON_ID=418940 /ORGANISM="Scyphosphaera apsteinii, Strain RCC1455" /LENGTH=40 /DNA_ID= /DNA_START= /DNA_END= /DNA_ORIENTATION=
MQHRILLLGIVDSRFAKIGADIVDEHVKPEVSTELFFKHL